VIVRAFALVSTTNAFALRGARIVFAEVRPDTLNLDETRLEPLNHAQNEAVVLIHYAGVGCEMDSISDIARHQGVKIAREP
jgi:dTDP-4-amino-4,6-dideoxygalactose transaminase